MLCALAHDLPGSNPAQGQDYTGYIGAVTRIALSEWSEFRGVSVTDVGQQVEHERPRVGDVRVLAG